ncbi:hypothetical protein PENCOP_c005G05750 [Penicillium coprophilum]|uniref:Enoyl reductase (ER) domain-containing protein n=1 Tax=Penicillium coprophilum TaxID=36646 RepID=A0A1V6URK5_9EURO|nr:hypothetical protein PENCOP_c005G05750 [Penicillium coprophilum]
MPHNAIWISHSSQLSVKRIQEQYTPFQVETLLKVAFSGINPADLKHGEHMGIVDCVAGYDFSGTVVQAGPGSRFRVGDNVAGLTPALNPRPHKYGSHQDYMLAPDSMVFPVPTHMSMSLAATLGVAMRTATDALFCQLGLPDPGGGLDVPPRGLLIWGGASGVGTAAIQLAAAVGLSPIVVTASPRNHEAMKRFGATHCVDYHDADVIDQIQRLARELGTPLRLAFDTIGYVGTEHMVDWCYRSCGDAATVVTTIPHPRALKCFATTANELSFDTPAGKVTFPARVADAQRTSRIVEWAVQNLHSLGMPPIRIVSGKDAIIKAIEESARGAASFEKVAVQHEIDS